MVKKATVKTAGQVFQSIISEVQVQRKIVSIQARERLTSHAMSKCAVRNNLSVTSGPHLSTYVRYIHNDWKTPDFTEYRRNSVRSPVCKSSESNGDRKLFTHVIGAVQCIAFLYGAKSSVIHFVSFMDASAEVLALAKIEINLDEIAEGTTATIKWRGKPLFIAHRTEAQINKERSVDIATLRHPETDDERVKDPKWLVVIGVCTHLGCVPIAGAGDYGGYYCPCHGSHFDGSGRTRKGPAPTNLEVPEYKFNGNIIIVG